MRATQQEREAIDAAGGPFQGEHGGRKTSLNCTVGGEGVLPAEDAMSGVRFDEFVRHLQEYAASHNNSMRVKQTYVSPDGYKLGHQVHGVRMNGTNIHKYPARREVLESMNFIWSDNEYKWRICQEALIRYKAQHGEPQDYVDTEHPTIQNYRLGNILYRVRRGTFGGCTWNEERLEWLKGMGYKPTCSIMQWMCWWAT